MVFSSMVMPSKNTGPNGVSEIDVPKVMLTDTQIVDAYLGFNT